jgi:L-seryl-tRNA(Ser) seleniumtransferase
MKIYQELGVEPLINASGNMTLLGGSIMPPEVTDAMAAASRHFVDLPQLHQAAGRRLAQLIGVEAAHVCACASAGITLMAAACITGTDSAKISRLPDTTGIRNKFIVHSTHRNPFDHAVQVAGGEFVEISADADELRRKLREDAAAVYYTFAHFCPGEALPLAHAVQIAHGAGVPVIVDAAAQVPPAGNLSRFLQEGADLVAFSGGKAIEGPQSSGLILGRKDLVRACAMNNSPNVSCIGRGMKAGKEEIVGLVRAVELYLQKDHGAEMEVWERRVAYLAGALPAMEGLHAERRLPDGIGGLAPYLAVFWDEAALGVTHRGVAERLRKGRPSIIVQVVGDQVPGVSHPELWLRVHTLQEGEEVVVARHLQQVLAGQGFCRLRRLLVD